MPAPIGSLRTRITSVASSATASQIFLPATPIAIRFGVSIFNDSTAVLYLKLGGSGPASTTDYTVQLAASGYYETPYNYGGAISGIWSSANGNARVTEYL